MPTLAVLDSLAQGGTASAYSTNAVTATANRLLVLALEWARADATDPPDISSVAGMGLTWTQVRRVNYDLGAGTFRGRMALYVAPITSTTSGQITATFAASAAHMTSQVFEVTTTFAATASAVPQSAEGTNGAAANIDMVLGGALASTSSVHLAIQACGNNTTPFWTPEGGATEHLDQRGNNGNSSLGTWSKTNDATISTTGAATTTLGWISIELAHNFGVYLSGSITPTGALFNTTSKFFAGSISPTGALALLMSRTIALAGSITPTGSLSKLMSKTLSGSITPTGNVVMVYFTQFLYPLVSTTLNLIARARDTLNLSPQSEDTLHLDPLEEDDR